MFRLVIREQRFDDIRPFLPHLCFDLFLNFAPCLLVSEHGAGESDHKDQQGREGQTDVKRQRRTHIRVIVLHPAGDRLVGDRANLSE